MDWRDMRARLTTIAALAGQPERDALRRDSTAPVLSSDFEDRGGPAGASCCHPERVSASLPRHGLRPARHR
eukprot:scaffold37214_cov32-Tisochrysis_lutea.AAC.2